MQGSPEELDRLPQGVPHRSRRGRLAARLRAYFLAGILITAPLGLTIYIAWVFITWVDGQVIPLLPARYNPENYLPFSVPGVGLVIVLVGLTAIGAITAGMLGRLFVGVSERLLNRMPVIRSLYAATKQIFETVLAHKATAFREVVLVEYPRRGSWVIGFITGTTEGEIQELTDEEMVNLFVPTTPNPTSGFLLFVPRSDIVPLQMSVEEGIKMVVSGGIVTPPDRRTPEERGRIIATRKSAAS